MQYIERKLQKTLDRVVKSFPVITITGPRQSGKTTLIRKYFQSLPYYNLENHDTRGMIISDPRSFLKTNPEGAILDEIHYLPGILSYLMQVVDENYEKVRFILSGSNNLTIMNNISQSLAGRTVILNLLPLSLEELQPSHEINTNGLLLKGFYPAIYSRRQEHGMVYRSYFDTYLLRDVRQLVNIKDLRTFETFVRLLAGRIGTIFNAAAISNETGVSVPTIKNWLSVLQASFIAFLLPPFHENIGKRLIKSPKVYFYDVGLAAYLLGIESENQMLRDPLRGNLFENMVINEIVKHRYNKGQDANIFFYRDSNQNEIDLIIRQGSFLTAMEIKSSRTYHNDFLKSLIYLSGIFHDKIDKQYLVYDGEQDQKINNIQVLNYRDLIHHLSL